MAKNVAQGRTGYKGIILAGGSGTRLYPLTRDRSKPAVPLAGKYRIIDFPLANCANSGITTVGVLTQYRPRSLNDHIRTGAPWPRRRPIAAPISGCRCARWPAVASAA